jgi:hypothetical protein
MPSRVGREINHHDQPAAAMRFRIFASLPLLPEISSITPLKPEKARQF